MTTQQHQYWVYIVTNPTKTILYIGVTNNLSLRLQQHYQNKGKELTFAGRFYCFNLVHFEEFKYIDKAIAREKQLKKWSRSKKNVLIERLNPQWKFQNSLFSSNVTET